MTDRDPQPPSPSRRSRLYVPPQPRDFHVRDERGREIRWLSRLVGWLLAPIFRWRMRRGWRPRA